MIAKEVIERCDNAIQDYCDSNLTLRELSSKYKVTRSFLSGYMLAKGIDIYSRKSHVNDTLFENIDTEEKAYWLGFLFADGSVYKFKKSQRVELTLKEDDLEHLMKFKTFLGWDKNPKYRSNQKAYRIIFGSRKVVEDLIVLGCTHRKSLTLKFPTKVPEPLIKHFIRGYFDGDGSISLKHNVNSEKPDVRILGTLEFLTSLKEYLHMDTPIIKKCKDNSSNNYYIYFNIKDSYTFLHYIYDEASIYLQRKYDKYVICRAFE